MDLLESEEPCVAVGSTGTLISLIGKELEVLQARKSCSVYGGARSETRRCGNGVSGPPGGLQQMSPSACCDSTSPSIKKPVTAAATVSHSFASSSSTWSDTPYNSAASSLWSDLKNSLMRSPAPYDRSRCLAVMKKRNDGAHQLHLKSLILCREIDRADIDDEKQPLVLWDDEAFTPPVKFQSNGGHPASSSSVPASPFTKTRRAHRDAHRSNKFGLPNLQSDLQYDLSTPQEMASLSNCSQKYATLTGQATESKVGASSSASATYRALLQEARRSNGSCQHMIISDRRCSFGRYNVDIVQDECHGNDEDAEELVCGTYGGDAEYCHRLPRHTKLMRWRLMLRLLLPEQRGVLLAPPSTPSSRTHPNNVNGNVLPPPAARQVHRRRVNVPSAATSSTAVAGCRSQLRLLSSSNVVDLQCCYVTTPPASAHYARITTSAPSSHFLAAPRSSSSVIVPNVRRRRLSFTGPAALFLSKK